MRKPPCPAWADAVEALASGMEASPGLREHLLECPACNAYYRDQSRLDALLHETAGALEDPWLAARPRRRRLSPWRITAVAAPVAAVLAAVVAVAVVMDAGSPGDDPGPGEQLVVEKQDVDVHGPLMPGEQVDEAQETHVKVLEETRLTTTGGEHVVRSFKGGLRISLSGEGDALVQRVGKNAYRIEMTSGLLVGDVPDTEPRMRVSVTAQNMEVRVKGTLFSVTAHDGRITRVDVERGTVEVHNRITQDVRTLGGGEKLEIEPVTVTERSEDSPSMLLSFLVEIPQEQTAPALAPQKHSTTHKSSPSGGAQASAEPSTYETAVALRKAGKYEEAVETFLKAASETTGLTQERCYYQAASLSLTKLSDPARTIVLSESYLAKFPSGFFVEEIMILEARAHLGAKQPEKARAVLVDYIDSYPDGSHQALAHLLLGKIFATTYGNCKSAESHLLYVEQSEPGSAWAKQARKILDYCGSD